MLRVSISSELCCRNICFHLAARSVSSIWFLEVRYMLSLSSVPRWEQNCLISFVKSLFCGIFWLLFQTLCRERKRTQNWNEWLIYQCCQSRGIWRGWTYSLPLFVPTNTNSATSAPALEQPRPPTWPPPSQQEVKKGRSIQAVFTNRSHIWIISYYAVYY